MKNHLWSLLACLAIGCGGETPQPAAPAAPASPAPTAAAPTAEPVLAASTPLKEVPITAKSPEAIEEFKAGRELLENIRPAEALPHLKKAIELDPDFAQAHAYLGFVLPGSEGIAALDKAAKL